MTNREVAYPERKSRFLLGGSSAWSQKFFQQITGYSTNLQGTYLTVSDVYVQQIVKSIYLRRHIE